MRIPMLAPPRKAAGVLSKVFLALVVAWLSLPASAQAIHSNLSAAGVVFGLVLPVALIVTTLCILGLRLRRSVLVGKLVATYAVCILLLVVLALANPFAALLVVLLPWPLALVTIFLAFWDAASRKDAARRDPLSRK
jgi:hypothetical protein